MRKRPVKGKGYHISYTYANEDGKLRIRARMIRLRDTAIYNSKTKKWDKPKKEKK
jgi:hypothetical protein